MECWPVVRRKYPRLCRESRLMNLDILKTLNEERAARRAVAVVTDIASGNQRLIKAADAGKDPLSELIRKAHPQRQKRHGGDACRAGFHHCACTVGSAYYYRRRSYFADLGAARADARLRRDNRRSADRVCDSGAFPRCESPSGMAGYGAAAAWHRPLHGVRRAHARPENRRPGFAACAQARLLLYRCAGLAKNPRQTRGAAQGCRIERCRCCTHPCAYRARHRSCFAGRDCGLDHGRDHRAACARAPTRHRWRHEVRPGPTRGGDRFDGGAFDPQRPISS